MPGRTFIIGDVHGCIGELHALVKRAGVTRDDSLIFVGDLVAKGPDSQAVVQYAREHKALAVCGNHDAHVLKARKGKTLRPQHESVAVTLREADWKYLEGLPLWLELPRLHSVIVHGGLVPGVPLKKQDGELLINLRSITPSGEPSRRVDAGVPWASRWPGPQFVVFGHDAMRGLQQHPFAWGLDTGCVYGKRLTGLWLEARQLISVDAKRQWIGFDAE